MLNKLQYKDLDIIKDIYEVFKDYYGEERVDLQNFPSEEDFNSVNQNVCNILNYFPIFIYIHFPEITVTNEYLESTTINDLYTRIRINADGKIYAYLEMLRATYTDIEILAGYKHSHLPKIYSEDDLYEWTNPCLGSGPIGTTIATLRNTSLSKDYLLSMYKLLCRELDEYVKVESLRGGPYIKLSSIYNNYNNNTKDINSALDKIFIPQSPTVCTNILLKLIIENNDLFPIIFRDGEYKFGLSNTDIIIKASALFIGYLNKQDDPKSILNKLEDRGVLIKATFDSLGDIASYSAQNSNMLNISCDDLLDFKGEKIPLTINKYDATAVRYFYIVHPNYISSVYNEILFYINSNYGK